MATAMAARLAARIPWVPFKNTSGMKIPPFSVILVKSWFCPDVTGDDIVVQGPYIQAIQSTGYGAQYLHYLTDAIDSPADGYGRCARPDDIPMLATVSSGATATTPNVLDMVGPSPNAWGLTLGSPGFVVLSTAQEGLALVHSRPHGPWVGLTNAAIPSGSFGPVISLIGPTGNESQSSVTLPKVFNGFGDLISGIPCLYDWSGQGYEITVADPCLTTAPTAPPNYPTPPSSPR